MTEEPKFCTGCGRALKERLSTSTGRYFLTCPEHILVRPFYKASYDNAVHTDFITDRSVGVQYDPQTGEKINA